MKQSLVAQLEAEVAARERRCRPACKREDWRDSQPANGLVRTSCGVCGTFIGYRPVDRKQATKLDTEAAAPQTTEAA
jgi:hypothetical protein